VAPVNCPSNRNWNFTGIVRPAFVCWIEADPSASSGGWNPRNSYARLYSDEVMQLAQWTPDGAAVIARAGREAQGRYVLVPAEGQGHRDLLPLTSGDDGWGDVSPDGRTLMVTHMADDRSGRISSASSRDLVAIDIATRTEVWRRAGPNDDYHGRWSPDGNSVVFASNAQGCDALYQLRLDAGRPVGSPIYLADLGRHRAFLYGFGSEGDLLLGHLPPTFSVFEADLDLRVQTLSGAHLMATSNCDMAMGAARSPDSDRVDT
jgi:dipeptidyl aminopeptidase/acylaminoacyl peptidase